ncbi:adenosylcobinamide amidohydrolase [Planococcus sp. MERTA32b]|nr:adenosylcobinamide amidohydrolase [Planococcus sp. MER TA 32b]
MLKVNRLSGGYGEKNIVSDVNFTVKEGKMLGILGPNGSGKSTLMKLMSGILEATSGSVVIDGKDLKDYAAKELAKKMAVLPQLHAHAFSHSVRETVSLGRYPHQRGWFSSWSKEDEEAVAGAMELMDIGRYEHTPIDQMSGGEQQRVFVAQALAQNASILLLDEPTNHLDINHQKELLDTIKRQAIEKNLTVISIFHDINLASMYCDSLLLLEQGRVAAIGEPHEVVKEKGIKKVYGTRISTHPHPELPKPQITLMPGIKRQVKNQQVRKEDFTISREMVLYRSEIPLKTVSSAVINAGSGWFTTFMNRRVDENYEVDDTVAELTGFIEERGFKPTDTVAMMTAVDVGQVVLGSCGFEGGSIVVAVTAGAGNGTDVSLTHKKERIKKVGTVNTWIFVNGILAEEAFLQAMMTATEAKAKAFQEEKVLDPFTGTIATGTPTDSVLVSSTQQGNEFQYAGPISELGRHIGKTVFEATTEAIRRYRSQAPH